MIDYLVYDQDTRPTAEDSPKLAVEETKTQDNKSRNVSTCQRLTKFSMIGERYPGIDTVMLYNENSLNPSKRKSIPASSARGIKMMRTLGVDVVGAERYESVKGYDSLQELIDDNKTPHSRAGNIPFTVTQPNDDTIVITAKLSKGKQEAICHDPNEGLIIGTAEAIRELGFKGDIVIQNHCVTQDAVNHMMPSNKFFGAARRLGISLDGISFPDAPSQQEPPYWRPEKSSEKVASILMEVMATNNGYEHVFANHAGCERGYARDVNGQEHEVPTSFGKIPDLVLYDRKKNELIVVEGKQLKTLNVGKQDLAKMGEFIDFLCGENDTGTPLYPKATVKSTISIYGGSNQEIPDEQVGFLVTDDGHVTATDLCSNFISPYGLSPSVPNAKSGTRSSKNDRGKATGRYNSANKSIFVDEDGEEYVWVDAYVRSDGVIVKAYKRRVGQRKS